MARLTRHLSENPSQQSGQSGAEPPGFNESAANRNGLDLLSCSQSLGSCADAGDLSFWQPTTKVVKNCLKSDLIAEVGRAKVPKKAKLPLHAIASFQLNT